VAWNVKSLCGSEVTMQNKKAELSQRRPRDVPNICMGTLISFESPDYAPGTFPEIYNGLFSDRY